MSELYLDHESAERVNSILDISVDPEYEKGKDGSINDVVEITSSLAEKALQETEMFYGISFNKKVPIVITDREGIDKTGGPKTEPWVAGQRTSKALYLLDTRLYANTADQFGYVPETEHKYSEESYLMLIKHELGHEIFGSICNIPSNKIKFLSWLNEGTQFYVAGQLKKEVENLDLTFIKKPYSKNFYRNSATLVKRIADYYGQETFTDGLKFILNRLGNAYSNAQENDVNLEQVFVDCFTKVFGITPDETGLNTILEDKE